MSKLLVISPTLHTHMLHYFITAIDKSNFLKIFQRHTYTKLLTVTGFPNVDNSRNLGGHKLQKGEGGMSSKGAIRGS